MFLLVPAYPGSGSKAVKRLLLLLLSEYYSLGITLYIIAESVLYLQLIVVDSKGQHLDRMSPWAQYVVSPEKSIVYEQQLWNPPQVSRLCYKNICCFTGIFIINH